MALFNINISANTKQLNFIIKQNQTIMAKIDELVQAVQDLQTSVDTTQAAIAAAITALEAQVAEGATPEQLQGVIDSLKAVQTDVESTPTS